MPPPTPNAEPSRPATNPVPHITQIFASNKVLSDMVASVVTEGQLKSVVVDTCQGLHCIRSAHCSVRRINAILWRY